MIMSSYEQVATKILKYLNDCYETGQVPRVKSLNAKSFRITGSSMMTFWSCNLASGVKQIKFVNEPGACKKCIPLQGGYPLDESPRIPKDTHPNCRCRRVPHIESEDDEKSDSTKRKAFLAGTVSAKSNKSEDNDNSDDEPDNVDDLEDYTIQTLENTHRIPTSSKKEEYRNGILKVRTDN